VRDNARAADLPALPQIVAERVGTVYAERIRGSVHARW